MAFGDPGAEGGDQATGGGGMGGTDGGSGGGRTDAEHTGAGYHGFQSGSYAADASATISAAIAESKGNINSDPRGYRAGNPHTDVINPDVAQATGWKGGQTLVDRYGQPVTLEAHKNAMPVAEMEQYRKQYFEDQEAKKGWNLPFVGKVDPTSVGRSAFFSAFGGGVGAIGSAVTTGLTAIGLPNIGPYMSEEDRNWDDARWGDNFDPNVVGTTPYSTDDQGNLTISIQGGANPVTSPAGGEVVNVESPAGAPDVRVTQFKALYPAEWTETLTDEEIIAMVENPDQLRYWLSWRQT